MSLITMGRKLTWSHFRDYAESTDHNGIKYLWATIDYVYTKFGIVRHKGTYRIFSVDGTYHRWLVAKDGRYIVCADQIDRHLEAYRARQSLLPNNSVADGREEAEALEGK